MPITNLTKEDLVSFETKIADIYNNGKIRAPIHLQDDSEDKIIEIFKEIKKEDWIFCSWRSHYQNLLKGRSQEELINEILAGRSISLCDKEHKIFSSAIVGGVLPIALGVALDIKQKNQNNKVWCWMGEMTSCNGLFYECVNYAMNWDLPITYIIENNGKSVCTDTYDVMNTSQLPYEPSKNNGVIKISKFLYYYWYNLDKYPHSGAGKRIQF